MASLAIKSSARVSQRHLRNPHVTRIMEIALETAPETTDDRVWITSGEDGTHSPTSLHYEEFGSLALDLRTRNIKAAGDVERASKRAMWAVRMRQRLGNDYDVVDEEDHLHVEFDPD